MLDLFTGKIRDSQMIRDSKIMELQKVFAAMDPTSKIAYLNVFDKGFRYWLDAQLNGQWVLQPVFARGDNSFSRSDVLHIAGVAIVRSGNERAVGRCEMSWFIKNGTCGSSMGY